MTELSSSFVSICEESEEVMNGHENTSLVRHFAKLATYRDNAVLPAFLVFVCFMLLSFI